MAKASKSSTKTTPSKGKPTQAKKAKGGPTNIEKILQAVASLHALGQAKPCKKQAQAMAGIPDKKTFDTYCGTMKNKKGLIVYDKETIELTEKGREEVGPAALEVAATNDAMHDKIKEQLKNKRSREIFEILADGRAWSKDELADKMGIENNKSFGTYLSALSKYTEKTKDGKYALKDEVFPFGRPCDE
ncbi:expressed unknown protein [Seminavis robusta]|uniref:Uncharacterized protein n=1 Tax=Seminavis robusta TaxID=568900 RepID=A0A9N8HM58_9STRA|nr:expressed unknown protein [Seminavis robusta]|eukprot:Sro970_g226340.1 n/a (189) ;mRNA; f:19077-19643